MYANNSITIRPGACNYAELMPQQLEVQGTGSLFLYFQKQKWEERWGDRPFPHLNAKVVHPSQINLGKFQKLWNSDRLIALTINQGQIQAVITCLQMQGNKPLPFVVSRKKIDEQAKKEFYILNVQELKTVAIDVFRQQFGQVYQSVFGQIKTATPVPPSIQVDTSPMFIQIYRCYKPGDVLSVAMPKDKYGRIKFRLYKPADADAGACIRFNPEYKINKHLIYSKTFYSKWPILLTDLSSAALLKSESQLKLAFLFAKVNEAFNSASFSKDANQVHRGTTQSRNEIISKISLDQYPVVEYIGSDGKKCEFVSAVKYQFCYDQSKPLTFPEVPGQLSLRETIRRARFTFDGADSSCRLTTQEQLIVSFYEVDKTFEEQKFLEGEIKLQQRRILLTKIAERKRILFPKFEESYIQYCRSVIGLNLDKLIGPLEGYFSLFSLSSNLSELNAMYSNNIPDKVISEHKGGLKSLLKSPLGGKNSSNEPEFLQDVVSKYLSGKANREGCLLILRNLKDTYLHMQEICKEIKFRFDILSEISSGNLNVSDLQDKYAQVKWFMDKISQEFARASI